MLPRHAGDVHVLHIKYLIWAPNAHYYIMEQCPEVYFWAEADNVHCVYFDLWCQWIILFWPLSDWSQQRNRSLKERHRPYIEFFICFLEGRLGNSEIWRKEGQMVSVESSKEFKEEISRTRQNNETREIVFSPCSRASLFVSYQMQWCPFSSLGIQGTNFPSIFLLNLALGKQQNSSMLE